MAELKSCPFCGKPATLTSDTRFPRPKCEPVKAYEVVCTNFDCIIYNADNKYYRTANAAKNAWNRRAEPTQEETTKELARFVAKSTWNRRADNGES